jgi:hypothetical protein
MMNKYKKDANDKKAPLSQYRKPNTNKDKKTPIEGTGSSSMVSDTYVTPEQLIKEFEDRQKARDSQDMAPVKSKKFNTSY